MYVELSNHVPIVQESLSSLRIFISRAEMFVCWLYRRDLETEDGYILIFIHSKLVLTRFKT